MTSVVVIISKSAGMVFKWKMIKCKLKSYIVLSTSCIFSCKGGGHKVRVCCDKVEHFSAVGGKLNKNILTSCSPGLKVVVHVSHGVHLGSHGPHLLLEAATSSTYNLWLSDKRTSYFSIPPTTDFSLTMSSLCSETSFSRLSIFSS